MDEMVMQEPALRIVEKRIVGKQRQGGKGIDLNLEHPDFTAEKNNYRRCRLLVQGGSNIEGQEEFLRRHVYETDEQYKIRLWLSKYKNHAEPVVALFHAAVWENTPDREKLGIDFNRYFDDVDCNRTETNHFFKRVSRAAAETGITFVLVDYTGAITNGTTTSKAEADKRQLRPYFKHIEAENLIDWGFAKDEQTGIKSLNYIVFKEETEISSVPFKEHEFQTLYHLWTKDKWEIWTQGTNKEAGKVKMIESGNHKCGLVPIVPCYFKHYKAMVGRSAAYDIVGLCERIYRNGSCLDKSLYDTAFPLQLFLGFTNEEIKGFQRSSSTGLISQSTDANSRYVEPEGRSFSELRQAIQSDETSIKEIALRMIRPESKVAESAESRKLDQRQLNSQLSQFASSVEECETQCWKIFGLWLGLKDPQVEIEYSKTFDDMAISVEMIKVFNELATANVLPQEDIIDVLIRSGFLPDTYDKTEAKEKLKDQSRTDLAFESAMQENVIQKDNEKSLTSDENDNPMLNEV